MKSRLTHLLLLLPLLMLLPPSAAAQRYYSPDFAIGLKGGATLGLMGLSPTVKQTVTPGTTFGLVARYCEEKHVGLMAEVNFAQRGWAEKFDPQAGLSYTRHLSYVEIPVMTHIFFGSESMRGFINLGPQAGWLVNDNIVANFNYHNPAGEANFPQNRRTEQLDMPVRYRLDYGILGGLGCELRLHRKHSLMLEGRYYFGLANIFPYSRGSIFGASRTMAISIAASYLFRVK